MNQTAPKSTDTGNDDDSGEPVGNRGEGDTSSPAGVEVPNGDRGEASGRNLEQLEQARGKP
jgi:hypothetical protein